MQRRRDVLDARPDGRERPFAPLALPRPLDDRDGLRRLAVEDPRGEVRVSHGDAEAAAACSKRQRTTGGSTNGDGPGHARSS